MGRRRRLLPLLLSLLLPAGGGCEADGAREPGGMGGGPGFAALQATDDIGRVVSLDRPARRIVSLLPATTATITALGAADRLVARTDYDQAAEVAHLPSVGGGLTPSIEFLASLRPDLVVTWEEAGAARIRPRLESLGIPVFAVQTRDTAGIYANIARLGTLLGLEQAADSLAAQIRAGLDEVRASVRGRPPRPALYLISVEPPIIAGPRLFIGELLEVAGGENVFGDAMAPSPVVSLEEIVRRRPDVVLVPTSADGEAVLARLRSTAGWRELIETHATRVATLPLDILHRPGPEIAIAASALRDALHPSVPARPGRPNGARAPGTDPTLAAPAAGR